MSQGFSKEKPEFQSDLLSGPVRTNFNAAQSTNSGPSAPNDPEEGWMWEDTSVPTNKKLKMFINGAWRIILSNIQAGPPSQSNVGKFVHSQVTSSDTWTINHNLETEEIGWSIQDSSKQALLPDNVDIQSDTLVVITFISPQTGKAVLFG